MRFRRKLEEPDESIELNLIPLIDIIMFLLIFFISTTSFIEEPGVQVNKARAASAKQLDKNSIIFAVTADGKVAYGGKEIGVGGVRPTVQRLSPGGEIPVVIQSDEHANAGLVISVIDEAKLAHKNQVVNLSTDKG